MLLVTDMTLWLWDGLHHPSHCIGGAVQGYCRMCLLLVSLIDERRQLLVVAGWALKGTWENFTANKITLPSCKVRWCAACPVRNWSLQPTQSGPVNYRLGIHPVRQQCTFRTSGVVTYLAVFVITEWNSLWEHGMIEIGFSMALCSFASTC